MVARVVEGDLTRLVPRLALAWDTEAPGDDWRVIEGTLCFADISGFTTLSDRLARRGRHGAEELVDTLDRVFGDMLDLAAGRGGDLLKFGGDALLLFFRGEGHELRAAAAAVGMRTALRRAAKVPTSVGKLRLSMSVGLHSGPLHLFLVGSTHRQLLVGGPVASVTAAVEHEANAGEIALSERTAAALPAGSIRQEPGGKRLLRWRNDPLAGTSSTSSETISCTAADPGDFLDPNLLGALERGRIEPEHRTASIGFLRYTGVDHALERRGPAETAIALQSVVSIVQEALASESLTLLEVDVDIDGGKFFVGSGVPAALEDDGGRMLRAFRAILDSGSVFPVQAGVARGHVFAAEVGSTTRSSYSAMGDTTNTAARLAGKAPPGHLYASPAAVNRARSVFAVGEPVSLPLKGKPQPVPVYDVGEWAGDRRDGAQGTLPFLGREDEVALLGKVIDRGGVVTITGGTGLGKTRLVAEVLARRPDRDTLLVRGEPYRINTPFLALRDPLRMVLGVERGPAEEMAIQLLAALDECAPELLPVAALIGDVASVPVPMSVEVRELDPRFRPDRTADAVLHLLRLFHRRPLVLVADDAHWLDQSSAQLLHRLSAAATDEGWTVLALRRTDGTDGFQPSIGDRLELAPLGDDVLQDLVHAATERRPLRPHVVDDITRQADGSPAYVEEIVRSFDQSGAAAQVPASLQAALAAQIDALAPRPRQVLRYASVLGRSFRLPVLQSLLGDLALPRSTWDQEGLGPFFVDEPPDRIRFRSGLLRDAAYDGLAYRVRIALHARAREVLEAFESDPDAIAAVLAEHSSLAGDHEHTWRYSLLAARQAAATGANGDAMRLYEHALDAGRRLDLPLAERAQGWMELGDVRERAGLYDDAHEAFRQAGLRLRGDDKMLAITRLRRARCRQRVGRYQAAHRELTAGTRLLQPSDDPFALRLRAEIEAFRAVLCQAQERTHRAKHVALRAMELGNAGRHEAAVARAAEVLDWAARMSGAATGTKHSGLARHLYERLGDRAGLARVTANLGVIHYYDGDWVAAIGFYEQSREAHEAMGDVVQAAAVAANIGELLLNQGRYDEAEVELTSARRVLRAAGLVEGVGFVDLHLGRLLAARGRSGEAHEFLAAVLAEQRRLGRGAAAAEAARYTADCLVDLDRPADALALLDEVVAAANGEHVVVGAALAHSRARALLALGRHAEALAVADQGIRTAEEQGLRYEAMALLDVRADLAGDDASDGLVDRRRAAAIAAALGITR